MKHLKTMICILAFMFIAAGFVALGVPSAQGGNPQIKCPVLGGVINRDVYTDYEGQRIYFCCPACPSEFKKDPAKYLKKLEEQGVTLEQAPAN